MLYAIAGLLALVIVIAIAVTFNSKKAPVAAPPPELKDPKSDTKTP